MFGVLEHPKSSCNTTGNSYGPAACSLSKLLVKQLAPGLSNALCVVDGKALVVLVSARLTELL
jgi:hypothetical protein